MIKLPNLESKREGYNMLSGQALLIVLLAMAVVLTVVLSVVSRSVTDVTVTSYEEDALRAFSAAEAGVEEALLEGVVGNPAPIPVDPSDPQSAVYDVEVTTPSEASKDFIYPEDLKSGEAATFWLANRNPDGHFDCSGSNPCVKPAQIRVCWGRQPELGNVNERPAVELMLYYDQSLSAIASPNNYSNVGVARFAYDRYASSRSTSNHFDSSGIGFNNCTIGGTTFLYRSKQVFPPTPLCGNEKGCMLMVKVRMYYNSTPQPLGIVVAGGADPLPAQGLLISSEGTAGDSTRKINVFQGFTEAPSVFDAAVFSMQDIVKN